MSLEVKIHEAQVAILRELLFHPSAGYAEMQKPTGLTSDHFNFHISRLVELGFVEKKQRGEYTLTHKGKEYANKLDTDSNTIERQPKVSVLIVGWRDREGTKEREFIMQQRLKNPYYGYWGWLGGKIRWGETVTEAAARELKEETGLEADLEYKGLYHKMDYNQQTREMLEDKFFFLVRATNFRGDLIVNYEGGKNAWCTAAEMDKLDKIFQGMRETYGYARGDQLTFNEQRFYYNPSEY
jgi:ADP-ribose pyrophosphatase YjhB (NUDIX family)/predicted transcriptional regulator